MKVLYLITKGVWGGAQRYVFDLAVGSQQAGDEVLVVHGQGTALPEKLAGAGIRSIFIESLGRDINPIADWQSFWAIYNLLKKERPNVLHINSPKAGGLGALAGRLVGRTKIIYTAHGWPFNEPLNWLAQASRKFFSWLTIMLCHQTIVIAKRELEQALALPLVPRRKIKLIYNGVGKVDFLSRNEARQALVPSSEYLVPSTHLIGTIAELHPNKGLRYLLEAIHQLPDQRKIILVIIGEGEERPRLEKIITDLELERRVFLLGNIPDAALYALAFDLVVLPSVKEGLPYAILEAGLAGLAVIATDVGGVPEIITDNKTGLLVPPADSSALTHALTHLINSPTEVARYGEALKQKVETDYALDQMLRLTRQIYQQPLK